MLEYYKVQGDENKSSSNCSPDNRVLHMNLTDRLVTATDNPATGTVTISGSLYRGKQLSYTVVGLSDLDGVGDLSAQWMRSNDTGSYDEIDGATGATYIRFIGCLQNHQTAHSFTDDLEMMRYWNLPKQM